MPSKPPFFAQERADTCALACLRMILAHNGIHFTEKQLLQQVNLEGGIDPDELARLVQACGLRAEVRQLELADLTALVGQGRFPIVLIDRTPIDQAFTVHAVIPYRVTSRFVAFLDPLFGERRVRRRVFEEAQQRVDRWCVVCESR